MKNNFADFYYNKKTKYGNQKVKSIEGTFDSKLEERRWSDLKLLQKCGAISDLERQKPFVIIEKSKYGQAIKYVADFVYTDCKTGKVVVEDCKCESTKTRVYLLKKRLLAEKYGIIIKEITKDDVR